MYIYRISGKKESFCLPNLPQKIEVFSSIQGWSNVDPIAEFILSMGISES
jgi:hypothetical protein